MERPAPTHLPNSPPATPPAVDPGLPAPADGPSGDVAPLGGPRAGATPSIRRRLAAFLYEGVLLFGVVMIAGLVFSIATQQRHALQGQLGMQAVLFGVLGLYFVWFWCHGGQTVAMQAWHVRLESAAGGPVGWPQATLRYLLAWLWFLPAAGVAHFSGLKGGPALCGALLVGVLAYAALAWLRPDRQFWHDVVCGTRLVHWQAPKSPKTQKVPKAATSAKPGTLSRPKP